MKERVESFMIDAVCKVIDNKKLTKDVYEITIDLQKEYTFQPGQFVELKLKECYLRRPISICDCSKNTITLLYKVVGKGTKILSKLQTNDNIQVLYPCGNGYDLNQLPHDVVVVGGGIGIPPLYYLSKQLLQEGHKVSAILGYQSKEDVFYKEEFEALGINVNITSVDGSIGTKGFVTTLLNKDNYVMACGPLGMLEAITKIVEDGQYSLEARMACGIGACMGCSIHTTKGSKRVCKDGPVFKQEELIW